MTAAPALLVKDDFGDWLSPMLVKELRQGVRTRVFVSLFILLQLVLLLNISLSLLVAAAMEDTATGSIFFWLTVSLPILVVLPLNALSTVGNEIKTNTLELTFLTRLTAFRIILGKWCAVLVQTVLLVCTVLPYLVLRYFIGGVNISSELEILATLLAVSALLTAGATALSAYPTRIVRGVATAVCVITFLGGVGGLNLVFYSPTAGPGLSGVEALGVFACGVILLLIFLEIGAARIAPPAENHSAALRLLAYCSLAVAGASCLGQDNGLVIVIAILIATGVCAISVSEKPRHVLSIFRGFASRGIAGRLAGRLLYPGWPSGVLFTLTIFGLVALLLGLQRNFQPQHTTELVATAGTLLLPVALTRAFLPRIKQPIAVFFAFQFFCLFVTIFCGVGDGVLKTDFKDASAFLPPCALMLSITDSAAITAGRLPIVGVTTAASLLILLVLVRREMKIIRREESESLQIPAPPPHVA